MDPDTTLLVTASLVVMPLLNGLKESNWNCVSDCWPWIPETSWRTSHSKDFRTLVMKWIKVPPSLFFFSFVFPPFLSALPCYCTQEACTGPAHTFSVLLSIVQTIYTVTHLLGKICRLHLLHLFSYGNLAILQIILLPVLRPFYVSWIFSDG